MARRGAPNALTSALPNQSAAAVTVGGGTGDDANNADQEEGVAAPVVPATAVLTPLARFVSGLDEAFEKVRLDARRGKTAPGPARGHRGPGDPGPGCRAGAVVARHHHARRPRSGPGRRARPDRWRRDPRRRCRAPCALGGGGPHTAADRRPRTDPTPATPPRGTPPRRSPRSPRSASRPSPGRW